MTTFIVCLLLATNAAALGGWLHAARENRALRAHLQVRAKLRVVK